MAEITLKSILEEMCDERAREFEQLACGRHFFSLRHRRTMNKILYPKPKVSGAGFKNIPIHRRIIVMLIVIFIAALGISAGASLFDGLRTEINPDGIEIITDDWKDSAQEITYLYHLTKVPEEFVFNGQGGGVDDIIYYEDYRSGKKLLVFMQTVKSNFHQTLNEGIVPEEVNINGKRGFYYEDRGIGTIFWDNGDYILMVTGSLPKEDNPSSVFTKEDLIKLAKSTKVSETLSQNYP
ncbi:MAG: DUF4367 domain-containing protein [Oscillospiraceae bacterium]|nr:DUF4367 domain-containing protein [Oscillospiraceae bacterium]